jgi:hypothetical protein
MGDIIIDPQYEQRNHRNPFALGSSNTANHQLDGMIEGDALAAIKIGIRPWLLKTKEPVLWENSLYAAGTLGFFLINQSNRFLGSLYTYITRHI